MLILAPANSILEAEEVFKAGANGIYIGGVTTIYSNFPQKNKRWGIGELQLSFDEYKKLIDFCKKKNKFVQFEIYTDCLSEAIDKNSLLIDYFMEYLNMGVAAGADSVLFDDIGAIIRAQAFANKIKINASFLFDTINREQLFFLEKLYVNTVELSPQLSYKEIKDMVKTSPVNLALISHFGCAAYEGVCYMDHFLSDGEKLIPVGLPCTANYEVYVDGQVIDGSFLNQSRSCSVCVMDKLQDLNLEYIKIPGRHIEFSNIIEWTKVYRYTLDLIDTNQSSEEIKEKVLIEFPKWRIWCRINKKKGCLYKDIN